MIRYSWSTNCHTFAAQVLWLERNGYSKVHTLLRI